MTRLVTIEYAAAVHLDALRDALADEVKSLANAIATRTGKDTIAVEDIDTAWDQIMEKKEPECDVSSERLVPRNNIWNGAIERVCSLKRAFASLVEAKAYETVRTNRPDDPVVRIPDIDGAWSGLTFGSNPKLRASALIAG
jgi:hypothetical protein